MDVRAAGGWLAVGVAFAAFISLGLPDAVVGVAWPTMRVELSRLISSLGWVIASGSAGYVVSSFLAGFALRVLGVGVVLLVSTSVVTMALLGYSVSPVFVAVCVSAFGVGLGSGAIDASLNAYVAERLPPVFMSWLHGFYGVGATIGPLLMTWAVTGGAGLGVETTWRTGYLLLAAMLGGLSLVFVLTLRIWPGPERHGAEGRPAKGTLSETLGSGGVWMQLGLFFVYCGIEVTAAQWIYSVMVEGRGRAEAVSGLAVTGYWLLFTVGRFVLGAMTVRVAPGRILRWATGLAPIPAVMLLVGGGAWAELASAAVLGFLLAPVYPMLMSETAARVGERLSRQAIGLQVSAAVVGVSVWPGVAGLAARAGGLVWVPVLILGLCVLMWLMHEVAVRRFGGGATS